MSVLGKIFGSGVAEPVEAVGSALDKLFTSDEERLDKQTALERLRQQPHLAQAAITQAEAQHRSVFVAGWRPAIGWCCAIALAFPYVINPVLQWYTGQPGPVLPTDSLMELILALLGLGALRTAEKFGKVAK
jgi:hypothetical protein